MQNIYLHQHTYSIKSYVINLELKNKVRLISDPIKFIDMEILNSISFLYFCGMTEIELLTLISSFRESFAY